MALIHAAAEAADTPRIVVIAGRHRIVIDEPPLFGGEDSAPSPVAMLLASLAGCVNAIGQHLAKEMGFAIRKLSIDIDGDIDSAAFLTGAGGSRAGFASIGIAIKLDADIGADQRAAWLHAVTERCPVIDNLINPTSLSLKLRD